MECPEAPSGLRWFGIFLVLGGFVLVLAMLMLARKLPPAARAHRAVAKAGAPSQGAEDGQGPPGAIQAPTVEELSRSIAAALAVLNDPSHADKAGALAALRAALAGAEPKVAIAAIRQFLKTGQDASTGLRFKVGEGGVLAEAPSLRTFLMDELGTFSTEAHTADGAEVARETLASKSSADEWAVAMRNLAWSDPEGSKDFLAAKMRELLSYQPWQQNPSGGYLEAFDVAAYSGDGSLMGDLAPLAKTRSPEQQAALVALERLSAMSPAKVSTYLNANPEVLADRPLLRADYMGNVNLADPAQQAQAEAYLRRADVSEAEKEKFLARLAMPAGFVSNNLLTPPDAMVGSIIEHRAIVNQAAINWLAAGTFPALTGPLQSLVQNTAAKP